MTSQISDWAKELLHDLHYAVLSTLNPDGSVQMTTMWYLLENDVTVVMNAPAQTRKVKNLRRDPRIAICVPDGNRYVSLSGQVSLIEDQSVVRQDIEHLVQRYVPDEAAHPQTIEYLFGQGRVSLHFTPEKVTEFSL
ncbi:TIGR03618 family F420-dependent PPOX class oxidoreductase [Ktedonosporobacter rubrisoli]|uniref:TIGR03618 family F420-dependent PPOX class oxidoreductase n=1 Tax=Ktedonosporobacter rubrisoli TaxID=2509675 RepID=A0A4P6JVW6_KTERU|nr:TIGR03618 family F420-dependent PPOX class oxidoreductase [Ktedonosporobacter rubrisoli]QBD79595.1 TIGR03618 family F420-dependent PPOX class oxidoreductase [Ktedonosporobacter rubrisoli]